MTAYNQPTLGRILVASTDRADCDLIRGHFESSGYTIDCRHAISDIYFSDLTNYVLVLMELPENLEDGIHAIELVKQNTLGLNTPLLVFSASSRSETIVEALNAGADDYVIKPFSVRELTARVRAVLRSTRRG